MRCSDGSDNFCGSVPVLLLPGNGNTDRVVDGSGSNTVYDP